MREAEEPRGRIPEYKAQRTSVTILFDGEPIVTSETPAIGGGFFSHHHGDRSAGFNTTIGYVAVDFSHFKDPYPGTENPMGKIILHSRALRSMGHSAERKRSDSLVGIRAIHTGKRGRGTEILGKDNAGKIHTLSVRI